MRKLFTHIFGVLCLAAPLLAVIFTWCISLDVFYKIYKFFIVGAKYTTPAL